MKEYNSIFRFITLGEINEYLKDIMNPYGKFTYFVAHRGEIYEARTYHNNQVWFECRTTDSLGAFLHPESHMTPNEGGKSYKWHYDYFKPGDIENALDARVVEVKEKGWIK